MRKFIKLLLPALGYMFMGNLLSDVMSISLAFFRMETLIMGLSTLFGIAIYVLLVSVPAYKDGLEENKRIKKSKGEYSSDLPKWRWAVIGAILWVIMIVPSVVFLIAEYNEGAYRFINGAVNPLSAFLLTGTGRFVENPAGEQVEVMKLASFAPYVFMGVYALTIPACHIGYVTGLRDSFSKDNIMYENKH